MITIPVWHSWRQYGGLFAGQGNGAGTDGGPLTSPPCGSGSGRRAHLTTDRWPPMVTERSLEAVQQHSIVSDMPDGFRLPGNERDTTGQTVNNGSEGECRSQPKIEDRTRGARKPGQWKFPSRQGCVLKPSPYLVLSNVVCSSLKWTDRSGTRRSSMMRNVR